MPDGTLPTAPLYNFEDRRGRHYQMTEERIRAWLTSCRLDELGLWPADFAALYLVLLVRGELNKELSK
jgi:hypothetical protein